MKILNVILTSVNGGAEKVFLDYCEVLQGLGHEVFAVVKDDAPYAKKLDELGVKYHATKNKYGYYDPFTVSNIKKAIQEFDVQVTISHAGKASVLTRKAIKKSKKNIYESCVNHSNNVKRSIGADLIINVNRNIFFKTIDAGQSEDKSVILHNAIATKDISAQKIDFYKKEIVIGMMARLDRHKGFIEALDAIKILQNNDLGKDFKLLIAGSGFFKERIAEHIANNNLEKQVSFSGWVNKPEDFLQKIDIFLFPSVKNETFGIVLLEAMQAHTPIICSDDFGPREVIRNQKDGLVVKLQPAATFSQRISESVIAMVRNPEKAEIMRSSAHQRLTNRFSFDNLKSNLRSLFGPRERL